MILYINMLKLWLVSFFRLPLYILEVNMLDFITISSAINTLPQFLTANSTPCSWKWYNFS